MKTRAERVQMGQDTALAGSSAGRAWAPSSPGASPCLLRAGLSIEGDLDPERPCEAERLGASVVTDGAHLESELLGLSDEGVPGDPDGGARQDAVLGAPLLQGPSSAPGADGAVSTDHDLSTSHGGGGEAGEGEDLLLLRPDDSGAATDDAVEKRALQRQSGGAAVAAGIKAGDGDPDARGGRGGDKARCGELEDNRASSPGDDPEGRLAGAP